MAEILIQPCFCFRKHFRRDNRLMDTLDKNNFALVILFYHFRFVICPLNLDCMAATIYSFTFLI